MGRTGAALLVLLGLSQAGERVVLGELFTSYS